MKYYFITYTAKSRKSQGSTSTWNQCINVSPMEFIKSFHEDVDENYYNFVVLNTCEISEEDYERYCLEF